MQLNSSLLFSEEEFNYASSLNGSNVKGSYSTMQFALRLRDDVRTALDSTEANELIQATSTLMHENIHWWQHVGSNFGFLYSLAYPAFVHISYDNFCKIVSKDLAYKSLLKFDKTYYTKYGKTDIPEINFILNSYYDLEYAKLFALDNKNIRKIFDDNRFFLNIGHCYHVLWSSTIHSIAATIDQGYEFLPNTVLWRDHFKLLSQNKVPDFFINSPIQISSIGIRAIYEGQAMFNQMQYLTASLNPELTYTDFIEAGILHGVYLEAFELFLQITKLSRPANMLDPIIGLYLLLCDISINPTNGFPLDIYDYEKFVLKNDPGARFHLLCETVSKKSTAFVERIIYYSKEEYISLSKELSESIGCKCPYTSIDIVLSWNKEAEVSKVLIEELELKFSTENLPIRLMFSKYYRFQEDKKLYPNVLCWFGYHASSPNTNAEFEVADSLYKKHHALFKEGNDGEIKPTIFDNRKNEDIMESFNSFYAFNILYDLILKWGHEEGKFKFDYTWLAGKTADSFTPIIKKNFEKHFGIEIDKIGIL